MRRAFVALVTAAAASAVSAQSNLPAAREMPPFLAPYYAPVFDVIGKDLALQQHGTKDTITSYFYSTPDQLASLAFESFPCERDRCQVLYNNSVGFFNKQATDNGGRFHQATPTEVSAAWKTGLSDNYAFAAKMPASILFVTYAARVNRHVDTEAFFGDLLIAANRQRYDLLQPGDPFDYGLWATAVHDYARWLLRENKKVEAVKVLSALITGAPYDYEAHIELIENGQDQDVARRSALVVYENAEDPQLVAKAAHYLDRTVPDIATVPEVTRFESGLQLILVVLPPCDIRLVGEVAAIYEKATGIPVHVRRLLDPWYLGEAGRIPDQRYIQQLILQASGPNVNFTGWTRSRYGEELLKSVEKSDALAKYSMQSFVAKLDAKPSQYDAKLFIARLAETLSIYKSSDFRTMYVGVTGVDLYSGDLNYLFSGHLPAGNVFTYNRMLASAAGDRFQSRKRLAERMAKELFPPTFATLGIPRPADPTDPYSYADSVQRVDEKTLTMSAPTKEALDKLR